MDILAQIRLAAASRCDQYAICSPSCNVTYAELIARTYGLAAILRDLKIGPGCRVAINLERSPEMVIGILGTLAVGATYIPLDPQHPQIRLQQILDNSDIQILLSNKNGNLLVDPHRTHQLDPSSWPRGGHIVDNKLKGPAYIMFTSGSTGHPKGVVIEHSSLENYLEWVLAELPFTGAGVPLFASISFDHSITTLFPPLMKGEPLILLPPTQSGRVLVEGLMRGHWFSYVKITPSHFRLLDRDQQAALGRKTDLLMFGGEALPPELIARARRDNSSLSVMNHYGPTEATVGCCVFRVPLNFESRVVPVGSPIKGAKASIRNPEHSLVEAGQRGELYVGGRALATGYWQNVLFTEQAFINIEGERWYRTGDLARQLNDGEIEYLGRRDNQVKILGQRIELGEIEAVLTLHPCVAEAVIVVVEHELAVELIAAVRTSSPISKEALRDYLRSTLPPSMIPLKILILSSLPMTNNGKLDHKAILDILEMETTDEAAMSGSTRSLEQIVETKFCEILGRDIGREVDFFEVGGDSLAAVEITMWAQERFQVPLELAALFTYSNVGSFSNHIHSLLTTRDHSKCELGRTR